MDEIQIIEVNAILKLVMATRLTDNEVIRLEKAGENPLDLCGYYGTANLTLGWRSSYDNDATKQITLLVTIAATDSCEITAANVETPIVNIPVFAGGL
jgi:hypothetical protein